ncbi:hypothetical protein RB595_008656 [Gaeumannomyces hyphopodioides]
MVRISFLTALTMAVSVLAAVTPNNAGAKNVGAAKAQQFITGGCVNNADCQSACCAGNGEGKGVCSASVAANQAGKTGCGFADPNATQTIAAAKAQVKKQGF